jgi:hypothetical protein
MFATSCRTYDRVPPTSSLPKILLGLAFGSSVTTAVGEGGIDGMVELVRILKRSMGVQLVTAVFLFSAVVGYIIHIRWGPCPHSMARPRVADGGTASSYGG